LVGCGTHRPPLPFIANQVGDVRPQCTQVPWGVEPPSPTAIHEIKQPASANSNNRQATGHRLLGDLAKRLVWASVDDDVQARERLRQVGAGKYAREVCAG
jgi:hypothetical protein